MKLINFILLQLLFHPLLIFELFLSSFLFSFFAFFLFARPLLSLLLEPLLSLFVLLFPPVLNLLFLFQFRLHLGHPVDVLDEELLLLISNERAIVLVLQLVLLLIQLVSFVTGAFSSLIYLIKFFFKRFPVLLFLVSLLFLVLDDFAEFFDFFLDFWKIDADFLFLFIADTKVFIDDLAFTNEFHRCLDEFDLGNKLSLSFVIKSLSFQSLLSLLDGLWNLLFFLSVSVNLFGETFSFGV